jgi:TonB family protein
MKPYLILPCLFLMLSLNAQDKPLHGKIKNFNADKTLQSIKEYDHGKRTGTWTTYYKDSGKLVEIYSKDSLMQHIRINAGADTTYKIVYSRFISDYRLYKTDIYYNSVLTVKKLHNYKGQDSIVEMLDADKSFQIIYPLEALIPEVKNDALISVDDLDDRVFVKVDKKAEFKGGNDSLIAFLNKNLVYPRQAKLYGITGEVIVSFIINTDGTISDVKVGKSSGSAILDREAVRVIKVSDHRWLSGKINGKPVRSYCQLPITFELE